MEAPAENYPDRQNGIRNNIFNFAEPWSKQIKMRCQDYCQYDQASGQEKNKQEA